MARHNRRTVRHWVQNWRRWIPAALLLGIALLFFLDWLANWERLRDPTEEKTLTAREQYRPGERSPEIFSENEMAVWYADRVRYRYPAADLDRVEVMLQAWEDLSAHVPPEVEQYLVPVPPPIVFEEGYEGDLAAYRTLVRELSEGAEVVDLYRILEERSGEYTYYLGSEELTNRGAYYAANELLEALEGENLPPLEDYTEELYYRSSLENTYLYTLPGSKGYCEAYTVTGGAVQSVKRSALQKSGASAGSVLALVSWAVVEGDGEEDKGALLLIGDNSGKALVPFLANYYHRIYYLSLAWDGQAEARLQPVEDVIEEYGIRRIAYVQAGPYMGSGTTTRAFTAFINRSQPAAVQAGGQDEGGMEG